jgi:HTH-type transcriptional regulator / antitoxin HigA
MSESTTFCPNWASPPGATIHDLLQERGQTIGDFASAMGNSIQQAEKLLNGSISITEQIASDLAGIFGGSSKFWLKREAQFRESQERIAYTEAWVRSLPINDLIRFNWIPKVSTIQEKINACFEFFGLSSINEWNDQCKLVTNSAAFRTSQTFESFDGAVFAWLRKGEIDSASIDCEKWSKEKFTSVLPEIRSLTREKDPSVFLPRLQNLCASAGVALVIARVPSGCRASGVTRFLTPEKALLMLSFRYLSDDHFWFSFFHEAGHLTLHDQKSIFIEGGDFCTGSEEDEANQFAAQLLVPDEYQEEMRNLPVNMRDIVRFARKIGISPGIVVGQLQHFGVLTRRQLNDLKVKFKWAED